MHVLWTVRHAAAVGSGDRASGAGGVNRATSNPMFMTHFMAYIAKTLKALVGPAYDTLRNPFRNT